MMRSLFGLSVLALLMTTGDASAQIIRPIGYRPGILPGRTLWPRPYYRNGYYPNYPIYNSPTVVTSAWPYGINTAGTTVYDSALSPWRTESMYNGTMHYVNHPVYGPYGEIIGWKRGEAWTDSVTGQQHFQGNVITPNDTGGYNNQTIMKSVAPSR